MSAAKNILVFPCGSEVALEIHRSLEHSIHFNMIGANSVNDHGKFVFKKYIDGIPFVNDSLFIPRMKEIVKEYQIDAIYPAMDSVITTLKQYEAELGCKVISSELETTEVCLSKSKTYTLLKDSIPTPVVFENVASISEYPVFLKPDIGYGSRGVKKANTESEVIEHLAKNADFLILEYLPGKEYTIDCFTNFEGELLFAGARQRKRISNGISVNTATMPKEKRFEELAILINTKLKLNGAWFFQVKERANGELVLMEIASRMGGSSSVHRALGVNFALLSLFNAFGQKVSINPNAYAVELDRALTSRYKINITFDHVYIDFDDTLLVHGLVNTGLVAAIFHFINQKKKIYLITKHDRDIHKTLVEYKLQNLFDEIIHLKKEDEKYKYIKHEDAIFIDDSHAERERISSELNIPVFSPDMVELFL
jgi:glutathione synthase/RimK-type ligase-like ATP-grasp enzyme